MVTNKQEYKMADLLFGQQVEEDDLEELGLSAKTRSCLVKAGVTTLIEVLELDDKATLSIPNMTKVMVKELKAKIIKFLRDSVVYDVRRKSSFVDDDDFE